MGRLGISCALWLVLAGGGCAPGPDVPSAASRVLEGAITPGRSLHWRLRPADDRPRLVWVEQHGVDVALTVSTPGSPTRRYDQPFDREAAEAVWIEGGGAAHDLTLEAHETGAPTGRYRLVVIPAPEPAAAYGDLAAAGAAYGVAGAGDPDALRRARDLYRAAGKTAASFPNAENKGLGKVAAYVSPPEIEALALQAEAVVGRLLGEPETALEVARVAAERWSALGDTAREGEMRNEIGLDLWLTGDTDAARREFERALTLLREGNADLSAAAAAANLCLMELTAGRLPEGARCYERALKELEAVQAPALEAGARVSAGRAWDLLGEPRRARAHFERARRLAARLGDTTAEAQALHNAAALARRTGDLEAALTGYDRALTLFRRLEDRRWEARTLSNLGSLYLHLDDPATALGYLEQALELRRAAGDRSGEAHTLDQVAFAHRRLGDTERAFALYRDALGLWADLDDPRGLAGARHRLGRALLERAETGDAAEAAHLLEPALAATTEAGDRLREAQIATTLSDARRAQGQPRPARDLAARALLAAREVTAPDETARAATALARAEAALGRPAEAEAAAREALAVLDDARAGGGNPELRAAHAGARREAAGVLTRLLLERGDAGGALQATEAACAWGLAEGIARGRRTDRNDDGASPLLAQRLRLLERLDAKAEALASDRLPPAGRAVVEAEERDLLRRLDLLAGSLRASAPRDAVWSDPPPLTAEAARALLEPGTAALVYALEPAAAWVVTPDTVVSFDLPPESTVRTLAREVHERLARPARSTARRAEVDARRAGGDALARLGSAVLEPAAAALGETAFRELRRLVVVPDGALHYVPFEALPAPGTGGREPVLERFEVTYVSSLTALSVERATRGDRAPATRPVMVVADPVFGARDPRVRAAAAREARPKTATPGSGLERLPGTAREARLIEALAPGGDAEMAIGFDARRDRVTGDALAPYRVVHFATHGLVDPLRPDRSGLALSAVAPNGHPRPGSLRLPDVYALNLSADLVVLSGCRTAVGRELAGDGLQGLARSFQYAGAPRVVASLWPVPDRATERLMGLFYRGMWRDGLSPAAALAAARRALRADRRTRDPYYWAGFLHLGDWRGPELRRIVPSSH